MKSSSMLMPTEDPRYALKNKALASAFFHKKSDRMQEVICRAAKESIRSFPAELNQVQLAELVNRILSNVLISVMAGSEQSTQKLLFERAKGAESVCLAEYLDCLIQDTILRSFSLHNLLFPPLVWCIWSPTDWRYARNVQRLRAHLRKLITIKQERREPG